MFGVMVAGLRVGKGAEPHAREFLKGGGAYKGTLEGIRGM